MIESSLAYCRKMSDRCRGWSVSVFSAGASERDGRANFGQGVWSRSPAAIRIAPCLFSWSDTMALSRLGMTGGQSQRPTASKCSAYQPREMQVPPMSAIGMAKAGET